MTTPTPTNHRPNTITRIAIAIATLALALAGALPTAAATSPNVNIDVTPSGNLTIEMLAPSLGLQILPNAFDGAYAIWIFDRDPNHPDARLIEAHNAFDVTKNTIITPTNANVVRVGNGDDPINFAGDLRLQGRDELGHWSFYLDRAQIGADLRINAGGRLHGSINHTNVADDTIIDGYGVTTIDLVNSFFTDRVRIAARELGSLDMIDFERVHAHDVLFIGGAGNDYWSARDSVMDEARARLRGGNDSVDMDLIDVANDFVVSTGAGDDTFGLSAATANIARIKLGAGTDWFATTGIALAQPQDSVLSGGGGEDTFVGADMVPTQLSIRAFEVIWDAI